MARRVREKKDESKKYKKYDGKEFIITFKDDGNEIPVRIMSFDKSNAHVESLVDGGITHWVVPLKNVDNMRNVDWNAVKSTIKLRYSNKN